MNNKFWLVLLVLMILIGGYFYFVNYLVTAPSSPDSIVTTPVESKNDLDTASDKLDVINVDSLDNGLNQLNLEAKKM